MFAAAEDHGFDLGAGADVDRSGEWWRLGNAARQTSGGEEAQVAEFDRMPVRERGGQVGDRLGTGGGLGADVGDQRPAGPIQINAAEVRAFGDEGRPW